MKEETSPGLFRNSLNEIEDLTYQIRRELIELLYRTGSGHLDTSLSLVEIWTSLVKSKFFNYDPKNGSWDGRDRIFLSEGHACPLQYVVNANLGYYSIEELFSGLRQPSTAFGGHTVRNLDYGFENSNGSLSIGLWQAYGHALEIKERVFCIAGDGEFQEPGAIGLLSAPHNLKPLGNFTLLLNNNHLAQDSEVDLGPIAEVAKLYGWQTIQVDGHNLEALGMAYKATLEDTENPALIVCNTIKGYRGDPVKAGKLGSHGVPPKNEESYKAYLAGLEASKEAK